MVQKGPLAVLGWRKPPRAKTHRGKKSYPNMSFLFCPKTAKNVVSILPKSVINMLLYGILFKECLVDLEAFFDILLLSSMETVAGMQHFF